jgi:CRISPR-associated protein Cst2
LDKGFVHLEQGFPLPYNTEFYNTHLEGVFCLDYQRLGVFWNLGDRIELDEEKAERFLGMNPPLIRLVEDKGTLGKIYEMTDAPTKRKERATALLQALAVLRGGAKQAQFGTDVAPKVLILAGLTCGNPIFNHVFRDATEGPELKVDALKEVIADYADRIVTPVLVGVRAGYLNTENEKVVQAMNGRYRVNRAGKPSIERVVDDGPISLDEYIEIEIKITTPLDSARCMGDFLI